MEFKQWLINEEKDACYHKVKSRYRVWPSAYASGALVKCRKVGAANWGNSKKESVECLCDACSAGISEGTFDLEKNKGLHGWFSRNKGKGWIDCKKSKKGKLVACGRKNAGKGAERSYPACRPKLSACNSSKHKKKSSKRIDWDKN
jgi:hypothetical protein